MSGTHREEGDSSDNMNQDEDGALIVLSLRWISPVGPQKMKRLEFSLEKMLQSWFNKCKPKVDCSVEKMLTDGRVVIKTKPAPGITELQKLSEQTLTGRDGSSVTIKAISLTLSSTEADTQVPEDASLNLPSTRPEPQTVHEQLLLGQQSSTASAAEEMPSCSVPVGLFWYVSHMYKEELKRIEEKNGVKIKAEVKVRFELDGRPGNPDKALDEFTSLVQNSTTESSGSVIPLKFIDPDQWRDALKTMQKKENKLLVTLTSEQMTLRGPRHNQDVITKFLYGDAHQKRNTRASLEEYERETEDTSLKIDMITKDHLMHTGLTMEKSYWDLMINSYSEKVAKIKEKFNVELKESDVGQGKVNVKAFYKKDGGNASMESHAVRGLFHLYQKIATSPMNFSQSRATTGTWWSWTWS